MAEGTTAGAAWISEKTAAAQTAKKQALRDAFNKVLSLLLCSDRLQIQTQFCLR